MAGIAVAKRACIAVENAAEKRHELISSDAFAQHAVHDPADARRAIQVAHGCAQAGLDIGHKQGGGNALAGDIGNAHGQPVAVEPQDIEVVSADRERRAPGGGYGDSRKLRNFLGQKRLLDFAGALQFLLVGNSAASENRCSHRLAAGADGRRRDDHRGAALLTGRTGIPPVPRPRQHCPERHRSDSVH